MADFLQRSWERGGGVTGKRGGVGGLAEGVGCLSSPAIFRFIDETMAALVPLVDQESIRWRMTDLLTL